MLLQNKHQQTKISLSELSDKELLKLILTFYDHKKYEEVIRITDKIYFTTSDQYWIFYLRGSSYSKLNFFDEAIENFKNCLKINPESESCYFEIANIYLNTKNFESAQLYYNEAISKKENYIEAMTNLAKLYKEINNFEKSKIYVNEALKINPKYPEALNLCGTLAEAQNDLITASINYKKSIQLNKSYYEPIYNLSLIQLYNGEFIEGFHNYNYRWQNPLFAICKLKTDRPLWTPDIKLNSNLTVWPEQGMGDYILHSRFFNDLSLILDSITVLIDRKLKSLYERSFPNINFVTQLNTDKVDYHAPIGDLAKFFVNSFEDVKARSNPYLTVDNSRTEHIKKLLPKGNKICGISWISANDDIGKNKSMTLEDMKDFLLLPNITFVDLQYTDTSEERANFKKKYGVEILKINEIDNFYDLDGLASLINACDHVVSVSNTTVHIAGSIGKNTYLMLPIGKGRLWYWSKEQEQSIWYKSIQIIEQTKVGSWDSVILNIINKFDKNKSLLSSLSLDNEVNSLIRLFKKGSYDEVIEKGKFIATTFNDSHMVFNLIGSAFSKIKNYNEARFYYEKSIKVNPKFYEGFYNLGYTYWELGQLDLAEKYCLKSLKLKPKYAFPYNTLGAVYEEKSEHQKSVQCYKKAILIDNDYVKPKYNLYLHYSYIGNFKEAWRFFEYRWEAINVQSQIKKISGIRWSLNLSNHVTIWAEQGVGDFVLYSRFFNDLSLILDSITVLIDRKLKSLYERSFPNINFVTQLNTDKVDYHAPIGDLAKFFVNSFEDVKARSNPYLTVDNSRTEHIKKLLPKGNKICGISWISANDDIGKNKSMTLEDMKDFLLLPNITFVDLQYTDTSEERANFKKKYGVEILKINEIDNFYDLDGLASLINACDHVVSVSNTTVHIAGSIGKNTYLMLPIGKGRLWYWSKEQEQSIWYKSIQIIEQTKVGSWNEVIDKIKNKFIGEF